jgi:hypothetical protein
MSEMFEKFIAALGLKPQQAEITQVVNLYDAVMAHNAWKKRLFEYLEGRSREDLQPTKICVDYLCVLGKWIHSDGKAQLARIFHHPRPESILKHRSRHQASSDCWMHKN